MHPKLFYPKIMLRIYFLKDGKEISDTCEVTVGKAYMMETTRTSLTPGGFD
jgi:hypothetical protein